MEAVFGLLVMLLGVSHGVETHCDGRQDGAQCYGPLGGTVVLQLMDEDSQIPKYEWRNESTIILRGKQNEIITNSLKDRSVFTPSNGTFRINKLSRTDSSEYTLSIFDSNGTLTSKKTLHLSIQAPVSSVLVVSECLSQGEMKVSCSSEGGDSPQYSWTLGGRALTDTELYSENKEENSITLKQHVSGRVACKVWNHVSTVSKEEDIMNCGFIYIYCISNGTNITQWVFAANNTLCIQSTTVTVVKETDIVSLTPSINITSFNETVTPSSDGPWYLSTDALPIMAGVLSALVIFLVVGVAVTCALKKKKNNKTKEGEDDQEVTYANVRMVQRQQRQVEQRGKVEVEYGQVKFSERPRQTQPAGEDCLYANVRKGR
ncbi:cell surface A33 antigen-like [Embiotoca jacksoni]|uniref:cell surface A33 antigen-like n=1 Tax=Embiotoca jacksoni TaxID=100190 RepID=UPI003704475A